jgi:hypothetical protein
MMMGVEMNQVECTCLHTALHQFLYFAAAIRAVSHSFLINLHPRHAIATMASRILSKGNNWLA